MKISLQRKIMKLILSGLSKIFLQLQSLKAWIGRSCRNFFLSYKFQVGRTNTSWDINSNGKTGQCIHWKKIETPCPKLISWLIGNLNNSSKNNLFDISRSLVFKNYNSYPDLRMCIALHLNLWDMLALDSSVFESRLSNTDFQAKQ